MQSVRSRPRIPRLLVILAMIAAPACAAGGAGGEEGVPAPAPRVFIEVENHNWADIVVYAVRNGMRTRLGMVTSMNRERFPVPAGLLASSGDVQLLADPIGGATPYLFPPVMVQQGQRVELRLENHLPLSSVSVW
ncbi:MAG TPA: hypothetical protein VF192_05910 [Longimicrobiales bacterium]